MKTIAEQWAEFECVVLPETAGPVQRRVMRRAFYGGFQASLSTGFALASEPDFDDELGVAMMKALHAECQQFAHEVAQGRA